MTWRWIAALSLGALGALAACSTFGQSPSGGPDDAGTETNVDGAIPGAGDAATACPPDPDPSAGCTNGLLRCGTPACEIDGLHDLNHCGICDRVCDDACDGGTCAPRHLDDHGNPATAGPDTRVTSADDDSVTWVVDGTAYRDPPDGGGLGGQGKSIVGSPGQIDDLAIDGPTAYALTPGAILRGAAIGDGPSPTILTEGLDVSLAGRLAFDDARVYFTTGKLGGEVAFVDKTTEYQTPSILANGLHIPTDVFTIGDGVVFLAQADDGQSNGAIEVALVGELGTARIKIQNLPHVGSLVATGDDEGFYSLVEAGEIWRFDTATFTPTRIASGLAAPARLAIDDVNLYFTASDGIYRMKRCGPPVTRITSDTHGSPTGLVVRGDFVYWAASGGLWRVTR